MTFNVKIHKDVIEAIKSLPSLLRTEAVRKFELILIGGHTYIPPFEIRYGFSRQFTIFANRNRADHIFNNCIILIGDHEDGIYYIDELRRVEDWVCQTTGENHTQYYRSNIHSRKTRGSDLNVTDYIAIDEFWVKSMISDAFSKKSYYDLPTSSKIAITRMMQLEERFYKDLTQINYYIEQRKIADSQRSYPYEAFDMDLDVRHFDSEFLKKNPSFDLTEFLHKRLKQNELSITNWLDLTDEWSGIQRELIGFITFYLRKSFPNLNIKMIDIVIKDEGGNTPYHPQFLMAHKDALNLGENPKPFSMFKALKFNHHHALGTTNIKNILEPLTSNVDLFKGCRRFNKELDSDRFEGCDKTYKKNLRGVIYELYKTASLASDYATITPIDLRGVSNQDATGVNVKYSLQEHCVGVTVYGNDDKAYQDAIDACCNAILRGCPAVSLLRLDGEDGVVRVGDFSAEYYGFDSKTDDCLFTAILVGLELLYKNHTLHDNREKFEHPFLTKLKKPLKINLDKYK